MKKDPLCGREVDPLRARAVAIIAGELVYFCSRAHRDAFVRETPRDDWDEPTPLPPIVAPDTDPVPMLELGARPARRGLWAFVVGLLRRFTL